MLCAALTQQSAEWLEGMPPGCTIALRSHTPDLKRWVKICGAVSRLLESWWPGLAFSWD